MTVNEECLKYAQKILTFVETLNKIELDIHKDDMKVIFLLNAKLVLNTVGLDNDLKELTEHQIYTYKTVLYYLHRVLSIEPFHTEGMSLFKYIHIYLVKFHSVRDNIKNLTEVLKVYPCDYELQLLLAMNYKAIDDMTNTNICLKLCCGIIDLVLQTQSHQKLEPIKQLKVKCLDMLADIHFCDYDYNTAEYYLLEALKVLHDDPDIHNRLGTIYKMTGFSTKAKKHFQISMKNYRKAHISLPNTLLAALYTNMADLYLNENNYQMTLHNYQKALEIDDTMLTAYQNMIFIYHYILHTLDDNLDPMYLYNLHKDITKYLQINMSMDNYVPKLDLINNIRVDKHCIDPIQKLNIGFVSGEFICKHVVAPVSFFINTILKYINHDIFNITCYSMKCVDTLQSLFPYITCKYINQSIVENPIEFKKIIVKDKIDILFDLISNTSHSQIKLFAEKPAPIQISYCGYPNTSGLPNMDYHITDKYCDSDGITLGPGCLVRPSTQKYYTEKLIFMNHCFLSYTPTVDSFPVLEIQPAKKNGYLTIGTFNKLNKLNDKVVRIWEQILKKCSNVKLVLKGKEFDTESIKENFFDLWKDKSVISQITFLPYANTYTEHLDAYNLIDIALDTLPYSGTTTTCEALMMGTPVVTLFDSKRQYHVQNVSSSLLINSDLAEFVTFTEEEYIDKVCYYATHLDEVIGMKERVRQKFSNGHVYDHIGFVDEFEDKLLEIYREQTQ